MEKIVLRVVVIALTLILVTREVGAYVNCPAIFFPQTALERFELARELSKTMSHMFEFELSKDDVKKIESSGFFVADDTAKVLPLNYKLRFDMDYLSLDMLVGILGGKCENSDIEEAVNRARVQ